MRSFHRKLFKDMPELPWAKRARYVSDFGMTEKEVAMFVDVPEISAYFEKTILSLAKDVKLVRLAINYILTDYIGLLKKEFGEGVWVAHVSKINTDEFSALVRLTGSGKVNSRGAKDVLAIIYTEGGDAEKIANEEGLIQKDVDLKPMAAKIVAENPIVVADYKAGKAAALQFFRWSRYESFKGKCQSGGS